MNARISHNAPQNLIWHAENQRPSNLRWATSFSSGRIRMGNVYTAEDLWSSEINTSPQQSSILSRNATAEATISKISTLPASNVTNGVVRCPSHFSSNDTDTGMSTRVTIRRYRRTKPEKSVVLEGGITATWYDGKILRLRTDGGHSIGRCLPSAHRNMGGSKKKVIGWFLHEVKRHWKTVRGPSSAIKATELDTLPLFPFL